MATTLTPWEKPIGIYPAFMAQAPTTLILREKVFSLSGDDFEIKTDQGAEILRCHGQVVSLSGRKGTILLNLAASTC